MENELLPITTSLAAFCYTFQVISVFFISKLCRQHRPERRGQRIYVAQASSPVPPCFVRPGLGTGEDAGATKCHSRPFPKIFTYFHKTLAFDFFMLYLVVALMGTYINYQLRIEN
jgi:hypothetical protein